ncbi:hypothetical protein HYDPIDRAFT_166464 [Hydnomerulius pinastri MD-312]|nr:hypothetical protein HYDPIDRAFT_166464 [Hydnomerulius pinastri MD-312]
MGLAAQVPLAFGNYADSPLPSSIGDHEDLPYWRLDVPPSTNATGHLVFETVHSLPTLAKHSHEEWRASLSTRPRTCESPMTPITPAGHNIVPGTIPTGTLLYHGTNRSELPANPEWTATDPEHSMIFCTDASGDGCWQTTLSTTRQLKVVYFDGSSAIKLEYGTVDTQDVLAWGMLKPDWILKEKQRIENLCSWRKDYGVDAFVRMEMNFEVMLCNFTSGIEVVSFPNLANKNPIGTRLGPLGPTTDFITTVIRTFEVFNTGSWHNRFPGETRIRFGLVLRY